MKSCYCSPQMDLPSYCGVASQGQLRRHQQALLGASLFFVFCWTLGALWLIDMRRSERSIEETLECKAIVVVQLNRD